MNPGTISVWRSRIVVTLIAIGAFAAIAGFLAYHATWPRGEALETALTAVIKRQGTDQALVATAILQNYTETRKNAARWSGVYWGATFAAALLSALAALALKLESFIKNEATKKDIAAVFSITSALLITISTSGDFQRKWQANRIAAAELERAGYEFVEKDGAEPRSYLHDVGQILLRRNMSILGITEQPGPGKDATKLSGDRAMQDTHEAAGHPGASE